MSYVTTTKQLLGEDLSHLISSITNLENDSEEHLRLTESAWHQIFDKYHTSVTDDHVIKSIDSLAEKFVMHGFDQKAKNLKTLISNYANLDFFKYKSDGTLKWGLILLLIRLSQRPTHALKDDAPICLELMTVEERKKNDDFDWGSYLKEGWENFRLPSDDESITFSDEESDRHSFDLDEIPSFRTTSSLSPALIKKPQASLPQLTIGEWDALCLENITGLEEWIESQYKTPWWKDPLFTENIVSSHPVANYCFLWIKATRKRGKNVEEVRIIGEYRMIQEFIFLMGTANGISTTLIDCKNGIYSLKTNICIPSLSPPMFQLVIEKELCNILPHIACLNEFQSKISEKKIKDNSISDTYLAYSRALGGILKEFKIELSNIENDWKRKEGVFTLRTIFHRLYPWFGNLQFLSFIHQKAIYSDFNNIDTWKCSIRLLSVLINEMKLISNSKYKKIALKLFLHSMSSYLRIIGRMMKGSVSPDPKNEFLIYESYNKKILNIHKYEPVLAEFNILATEFWNPFVSCCFRAISSTHFLSKLHKRSEFSKRNVNEDVLLNDMIVLIRDLLSSICVLEKASDNLRYIPPACTGPHNTLGVYPSFSAMYYQTKGCYIINKVFDSLTEPKVSLVDLKSPIDKLMDEIDVVDLGSFPIVIFLPNMFATVFRKYMEPVGFAYDALINEFSLLEHLRCLRRIYFIHILEPFVLTLFNKVAKKMQKSCDWTALLRSTIAENYDIKMANRFHCFVSQVNLIDSNNPKFVHDSLSFAKITYEADSELKGIISDSCIKAYNEIFKFLLQVKWAYHLVTKRFQLRGVEPTVENDGIFRRMYLLRMELVNTMTVLKNYFFSMNEKVFDEKMKKLCTEARDLPTIEQAHKDFLLECKLHCFLNRKHKCHLLVNALLVLCFKCVKSWWFRQHLMDYDVQMLEDEYYKIIENLIKHLPKYETDFSGVLRSHFLFLQSELAASSPAFRSSQ